MKLSTLKVTATGNITTNAAFLAAVLIGTDGVNDPAVTVNDGSGGDELVPTATYDASALGLNGFQAGNHLADCPNGIHLTIACVGTVEVVVWYRDAHEVVGKSQDSII